MWRDQFDASNDIEGCSGGTQRRLVLASTPRCGSHMLGRMLQATGRMGDPLEYFNARNLREWGRLAAEAGQSVRAHIEDRRTSPDGVFSMKLHSTHVSAALHQYSTSELFGSGAVVVRIRREDVLAQAVSLSVARQTGVWISDTTPTGEAIYDAGHIGQALLDLVTYEAQWSALLSLSAATVVDVGFEEMTDDPATVVTRVARAVLGDTALASVDLAGIQPQTRPQSTSRTAEWRERFRQEQGIDGESVSTALRRVLAMSPPTESIGAKALVRLKGLTPGL